MSEPLTDVRYINQAKSTRHADDYSAGWQDFCGGHKTMEGAIICKEQQRETSKQEALRNPRYAKDLEGWTIEQRIIKLTTVTEIVEEAEVFTL
jgi:hypothetical protein